MPQNANAATIAKNPSGAQVPLNTDDSGNLRVADGGSAVISVASNVGTIAATGTFQAAFLANASRAGGGAFVNNGTATMDVYFGSHTAAGIAASKSIKVAAGSVLFLNQVINDGLYLGEIAVAGTAADTYTTVENSIT